MKAPPVERPRGAFPLDLCKRRTFFDRPRGKISGGGRLSSEHHFAHRRCTLPTRNCCHGYWTSMARRSCSTRSNGRAAPRTLSRKRLSNSCNNDRCQTTLSVGSIASCEMEPSARRAPRPDEFVTKTSAAGYREPWFKPSLDDEWTLARLRPHSNRFRSMSARLLFCGSGAADRLMRSPS